MQNQQERTMDGSKSKMENLPAIHRFHVNKNLFITTACRAREAGDLRDLVTALQCSRGRRFFLCNFDS